MTTPTPAGLLADVELSYVQTPGGTTDDLTALGAITPLVALPDDITFTVGGLTETIVKGAPAGVPISFNAPFDVTEVSSDLVVEGLFGKGTTRTYSNGGNSYVNGKQSGVQVDANGYIAVLTNLARKDLVFTATAINGSATFGPFTFEIAETHGLYFVVRVAVGQKPGGLVGWYAGGTTIPAFYWEARTLAPAL